jgi:hypothetical protein
MPPGIARQVTTPEVVMNIGVHRTHRIRHHLRHKNAGSADPMINPTSGIKTVANTRHAITITAPTKNPININTIIDTTSMVTTNVTIVTGITAMINAIHHTIRRVMITGIIPGRITGCTNGINIFIIERRGITPGS